jgi:metallo-beta-lactamase family protein
LVEEMRHQLAEVIERTPKRGGKVIIPSFALERTQEIVVAINRLFKSEQLEPLQIYVDSPLAANLTEVFRRHPDCVTTASRTKSNGRDLRA